MPPRQSLRQRKVAAEAKEEAVEVKEEAVLETKSTPLRNKKATVSTVAASAKRKAEAAGDGDEAANTVVKEEEDKTTVVPAPEGGAAKKRKTTTKTTKGSSSKPEAMAPLAARTAVASLRHAVHVGAHVSAAGGVQNAVHNAVHVGANAFALFLKSQRKWDNPALAPAARDDFRRLAAAHDFDARRNCVPHGSYLVNLAAAEPAKADQAYDAFLDDLRRCEELGIGLYNFHPGNTNGGDRDAALARIANQLNKAHAATTSVVTLLENMAGQGNVVGGRFEDLRDIIALVADKARVGVCLDTCHTFAAGYDLRTPATFEATVREFDTVVGLPYLRAFHLNDSKAPLASHRDLHAKIGTGFLGLRAFHHVVNHTPFQGLPMVLETPIDTMGPDGKTVEDKQVWADEIKLLERLVGMDADGPEFAALEARLHAQGEGERSKIQAQVDNKAVKDAKKSAKAAAKGGAAATRKQPPAKRRKKAEAASSDEHKSDSEVD